eukprot:m.34790 g.34790  ORF g.34790 m.34790 type:complete len:383 (+) comp9951_c0_seq1:24-1172(+)
MEGHMFKVNQTSFQLSAKAPSYVLFMQARDSVLAVGASNNVIKLYNLETFRLITKLEGHKGFVVGLKFDPENADCLWSCSKDGTIMSWDVQHGLYDVVFRIPKFTPLCFDMSVDGKYFVVGCACVSGEDEAEAPVFVFQRGVSEPIAVLEMHSDDVVRVTFNKQQPAMFASASMDGAANIVDVSLFESVDDADDAITITLMADSSLEKVGFFGDSGEFLYGLTHDERLVLWHAHPREEDEDELISSFDDPRACVQGFEAHYLVDLIYTGGRLFLLAGNDDDGSLCLCHVNLGSIEAVSLLPEAHCNRVRCVLWEAEKDMLITGGDDTSICSWSSTAPQPSASSQNKTKRHEGEDERDQAKGGDRNQQTESKKAFAKGVMDNM